jgi:hypothetical protein
MSAQSDLFSVQKAVQETSRQAYREIAPTLAEREGQVYGFLTGWLMVNQPPTAYELFDRMQRAGITKDLNAVRPRLTSLEAKGLIEKGPKRACRITGKTAFTWRLVTEGVR